MLGKLIVESVKELVVVVVAKTKMPECRRNRKCLSLQEPMR